ncbi:Kinesin motor domain-containing protein [Trichostrongylus colubriformis]|uniref:Kinesin-like protein n=1 Tax=Trichostrongylus colubriformis TaxID=6319 RepID=A0AAN8J3M2_TRICO
MSIPSKKLDKINVRVAVRVRPMNEIERLNNATSVVKVEEKKLMVTCKSKAFSAFDKVYGPSTTQERIYADMIYPQVERVLAGYNCTLFAYGQTGTGKTYTMEGGNSEQSSYKQDPTTGVIPRAVEHIFEELEKSNTEEYSVRISYLELYNEELIDLLAPTTGDRERLRIFDNPSKKGTVVISGAEELPIKDRSQVYALLKRGAEKRKTAATLMNMHSSRSHSIFTISVAMRENTPNGEELVKQGKLNLVDLAGSEHIGRSGAEGVRAKEAGNINQSLLTLGRVITALTTSAPHVPYRESKLTRLLQDSLGGSTITSIIATLSPASTNYEESISTLEYAARAKSIKNHPECNQKLSRKALLKEYNEEIERLRRDLRTAREKNGIFLSQESYEGMEQEIAVKTEKLRELEGQLDAAVGKLQKFIEDQELMDEQYRALYHRNKRLEGKLQQRVDELDDTKKELRLTTQRLNTVDGAFEEVHGLATQLYTRLKEAREMVFDQQLDIENWWKKETHLSQVIAQNKQVVAAAREKVMAEVTACCSAISSFIESGAEHREAINRAVEARLSAVSDSLNGCKDSASRGVEELRKWMEDCEELCRNVVPKIIALSDGSSLLVNEKLNSQIEELNAMNSEVLQLLSTVKGETQKLSQILQELRKDSDVMLRMRRECTERNLALRANSIATLRQREQRTHKITELAQAILTECLHCQTENRDTFEQMEAEDKELMETNQREIQRWQSILQGYEAAAGMAITSTNEMVGEASRTITNGISSSVGVLEETCAHAAEASASEKVLLSYVDEATRKHKGMGSTVVEEFNSVIERSTEVQAVVAENERIRKERQDSRAKIEYTIAQNLRDHLEEVNKEILAMVDINYLSPKKTGKTPPKSHYPVPRDAEIPHVPKKEKILSSKNVEHQTPRKKLSRTRESLLEVQNNCLSPDTFAAARKRCLEDIGEGSVSHPMEHAARHRKK